MFYIWLTHENSRLKSPGIWPCKIAIVFVVSYIRQHSSVEIIILNEALLHDARGFKTISWVM